jgi:hypothetical protein
MESRRSGPKSANRGWLKAGGPLPQKVQGLSPSELEHYRTLSAGLKATGVGGKCDLPFVLLVSRQMARLDKLLVEFDNLTDLMTASASGTKKIHPIVDAVGNLESQLISNLAQLLLTPRSRASSRLPASEQGGGEEPTNLPAIFKIAKKN